MENTIKFVSRLHEQPSQMNTKSVFGNIVGKDSLCPKSHSRSLSVALSVNSVLDHY
jgi:hypothetical protein